MVDHLHTERLLLRRWRPEDRDPFARLNADPDTMEYLPSTLTRAESDDLVDRIEAQFDEQGFGLWAVEVRATGVFCGYTGLWPATFDAPFNPSIEIGWRLAREHWGNGYAPEAARAAVADGFGRVGLREVVSFTAEVNHRSRRVMEKIGMVHEAANSFEHPSVPEGHPLRPHVLYRIQSPAWG